LLNCGNNPGKNHAHRDPFDRIIIATAIEYQGKLASIDGYFRQYPELTSLLMI